MEENKKDIQHEEKEMNENIQEETTETSSENAADDKLTELEAQVQEQKDKFLRLFAEFDNYKKRMAKEKLEYMSMAGKDIILEFVSVNDDMERAMQSMESATDIDSVKEGVELIFNKVNSIFDRKNVKKIESKGKEFDTELHEAITEIPVKSKKEVGKVIDVVEEGYTMNGNIIRFAKVVVGKKS